MNFYHETSEEFAIEIFTQGKLSANNSNTSYATQVIDKILENQLEKNIRENAIYMWQKIGYAGESEYVFEINIDELDITKLYVGDFESINDLYNSANHHLHHTESKEFLSEAKALSEKYKKSFMPFKEYLENKDEYEKEYTPEFLYFGEIDVKRDEGYIEYLESGYDVSI